MLTVTLCSTNGNLIYPFRRATIGAARVTVWWPVDRRLVAEQAMATAKEAQHDAAESIFGAIIAVLDKHEHQHTLTPEILEQLAGAYAAVASNVPEPARLGA
jgi:hypothetical protein